ncbi:MAG: DUF2764 domain-containing protein [Verrucomicrobia bacterium]|nr:DUF2764 domain-containing protein [Verrucomicrobiota bacterium]
MSYFYLVASLPTLDLGDTPPFTAEEFVFHSTGALSAEDQLELEHLVNGNENECSSAFAAQWFGADTQMRNAIARARANRRSVDAKSFIRSHQGFYGIIEKAVTEAFAKQSPLDREFTLDRCRWTILDELAQGDPFGLAQVLAFGVKVQITARWAAMKEEKGMERVEALIEANVSEHGNEPGEAAA